MAVTETLTAGLRGMFRDVLRDAAGRPIWQSAWQSNAIVADCRRLLAAFMHGPPTVSLGVVGLLVGAGLDTWDTSGPPLPSGNETSLIDAHPFLVPSSQLQLDYLDGTTVSATPTNRLQIVASLGPNVPTWPDPYHTTGNLREFGLAAELNGVPVLINYVTHAVIAKDPTSTLDRTIWLVF